MSPNNNYNLDEQYRESVKKLKDIKSYSGLLWFLGLIAVIIIVAAVWKSDTLFHKDKDFTEMNNKEKQQFIDWKDKKDQERIDKENTGK